MSTCRPNKDCIVELLVSLLGDQNYWQWQNYKQNQRASSFSDFIFGETILAQYSNSKDLYLKLIEGFLIFTSLKKNFLMLVLKIICCKRCCNVSLTINTHISQKKSTCSLNTIMFLVDILQCELLDIKMPPTYCLLSLFQ